MTDENRRNLFLGAFALSFYWVIAIWNFWSNFHDALGFNATIFIFGLLALFFYTISNKKLILENYHWIIPIALIGLSFSLYENPFLKVVNILLLPFILSIFFASSLVPKSKKWGLDSIEFVFNRILLITKIGDAFKIISEKANLKNNKLNFFFKIFFGILLFLIIALTIIVPLLSSADPVFAELMRSITEWFYNILSLEYLGRVVFALVFGLFLMSYYLSFDIEKKKQEKAEGSLKLIDPIVSGIVLGGILVVYILFILTQLSHLWVNQLPIIFSDTEKLVKGGFWQLIFLSGINIIFYLGYYRKTNKFVQNILKIFSVASLLLVASAGQRMFLYVFYYGFSYEKFFAFYTVVYCFIVFSWLIYKLISNGKGDMLKFIIFSLLWMYSILTVLPVERIVFNANVTLSQQKNSRIDLYELRMLSFDALPAVAVYRKDEEWQKKWGYWVSEKIEKNNKKKWYEKNVGNFIDNKMLEGWDLEKLKNYDRNGNFKNDNKQKEVTWKVFENDTLGIKFDYPSDWGDLRTNFTRSTCPRKESSVVADKGFECASANISDKNNFMFATADVNKIISGKNDLNMNGFCEGKDSGCEIIKTSNGVYFAKIFRPITNDEIYLTRLRYLKSDTYLELIFSTENIESYYPESKEDIKKVIDSLVFYP